MKNLKSVVASASLTSAKKAIIGMKILVAVCAVQVLTLVLMASTGIANYASADALQKTVAINQFTQSMTLKSVNASVLKTQATNAILTNISTTTVALVFAHQTKSAMKVTSGTLELAAALRLHAIALLDSSLTAKLTVVKVNANVFHNLAPAITNGITFTASANLLMNNAVLVTSGTHHQLPADAIILIKFLKVNTGTW